MTINALEQRLRELTVPGLDPGRISARALAAARGRRRRLNFRIAAPAALILLVGLVAYFVPAADTAAANVPIAGDLLRNAGLVAARDRITSVGDRATSSGFTITLVGAYADSTRTVLLVRSNPASLPGFGEPQLTDQFGRTYHYQGGTTDMRNGEESMQFDALAWPDALTGARIRLHLSSLEPIPQDAGIPRRIAGDWTLHAIIGVDESKSLPLPAPASLGKAQFRFTSVVYTPATISVDLIETGLTADELDARIPDGGKGTAAFDIFLYDPGGEVINGTWGWGGDGSTTVQIDFLAYRVSGAGRYVLRVSYVGGGSFERELNIRN